MSRVWHISHVIVLAAVVVFVLGFVAAMNWTSGITNPMAWTTAGLAVFAASFLPWRAP
jgi:Trk-type K+ transport system membrane component